MGGTPPFIYFFYIRTIEFPRARIWINAMRARSHIAIYKLCVCVCGRRDDDTREIWRCICDDNVMHVVYTRDMFEWYVLFDDPWLNRFIIVKYFVLKCMSNWVLIFFLGNGTAGGFQLPLCVYGVPFNYNFMYLWQSVQHAILNLRKTLLI